MRAAIDDCRKRDACDCRALIAKLEQLRQLGLSYPFEFVYWKRWVQSDIREQSKGTVELRGWSMERQRARLPAARWRKPDSQKCDLIRYFKAFAGGRSFPQHRGDKVRNSWLACRISGASAAYQQNEVGERELMLFHDHEPQTIRKLPRSDWRQRKLRRWTKLRGLTPIEGSLGGGN